MKPFRDVCPKVPAFAQLLIFPPMLWWLFLHCDFHFKIAAVLPSLCRSSDPDNNVWSRRPPDIINNPAIRPRWPMPSCYRHFLNQHSSGATDWKKPKENRNFGVNTQSSSVKKIELYCNILPKAKRKGRQQVKKKPIDSSHQHPHKLTERSSNALKLQFRMPLRLIFKYPVFNLRALLKK